MKIHPSITFARLSDAFSRNMEDFAEPGFCISCGRESEKHFGFDAVEKCAHCGEIAVYYWADLYQQGYGH